MKKLIAAYVDRILYFDSKKEMDKYLDTVRLRGEYRVVFRIHTGRVWWIRIQQQYNNAPMIDEGMDAHDYIRKNSI